MGEIIKRIFKDSFIAWIILAMLVLIIRFLAAKNGALHFLLGGESLLGIPMNTIVFSVSALVLSLISLYFSRAYVSESISKTISIAIIAIIVFIIPFYILGFISTVDNCTDMCGLGAVILWGLIFILSVAASALSIIYILVIRFSLLSRIRGALLLMLLFGIFLILLYLNYNLFLGCNPDDKECFAKKAIENNDYTICKKSLYMDDCFYILLRKTEDSIICDKNYINKSGCYTTYAMIVGRPDLCPSDGCKESAFESLAERQKDVKYCDEAEKYRYKYNNEKETFRKFQCYGAVAGLKNDVSLCDNLSVEYLDKMDNSPHDICFASFAVARKDKKYCEKISTKFNQMSCEQQLGLSDEYYNNY